MKILALDVSKTAVGWAATKSRGGTYSLGKHADETGESYLVRFQAWLRDMIKQHDIKLVLFEIPSVGRGVRANHKSHGLLKMLQGVLHLVVETTDGVDAIGVNIQTIKAEARKFAGQKFSMKKSFTKDQMLAAARKRWKFKVVDDNHSDALWLLEYGTRVYGECVSY